MAAPEVRQSRAHGHRRGSQKTPRRATLVVVDVPAMGSFAYGMKEELLIKGGANEIGSDQTE